ncbi:MAG: inositol monophosphatase family protein [Planctomycetota bacterium]|nr:inositol monophosphatase family protein [Planctomycetota bacterium]
MSLDGAELDRILAVAKDAARKAGQLLLETYGTIEAGGFRRKSSARDLVTETDVASERLIVEILRGAFPGHRIEAEEEVQDAPDEDRPRWFVDPLDGTVNFVQGLPLFCVSMGLYLGGKPQVAVVYAPVMDEMFATRLGGGASLESPQGTRVLEVSGKTELSESILATGFPYRREVLRPSNLENFSGFFFGVRGMRRMGSAALDLAYVAAGRLDGFWELYLSPHDVAGGALLVREAGGVVTDSEGGEDWLRGGHIVACGPGIHGAVRQGVAGPDPDWLA